MIIDWWALGLQTINFLILVLLLAHFFWRPIAGAITKRKNATQEMLDGAKAAQEKADEALTKVTLAQEGIAGERDTILSDATAAAEVTTKSMVKEANAKVEKIMTAAKVANERRDAATRKETITQACELAVEVAGKLLKRFDAAGVQAAFLSLLIDALTEMPEDNRAALLDTPDGLDLLSAADLTESEKKEITKAVGQALGGSPKLTFVTEPTLIAGLEIRTDHFVLHNSWQADLTKILKDLEYAD